jgi:hypothetical protein
MEMERQHRGLEVFISQPWFFFFFIRMYWQAAGFISPQAVGYEDHMHRDGES